MLFLGTVSEHTMLLEGVSSRPAPAGNCAPVTGAEIMRKLSKSHTHSESALRIKVCAVCWLNKDHFVSVISRNIGAISRFLNC